MPEKDLREDIAADEQSESSVNNAQLKAEREQITMQYRGYFHETFKEKKVAGREETIQLQAWVSTQDTSIEGIQSLQKFYDGFLKEQLSSGRRLHSDFHAEINAALSKRWISKKSHSEWVKRFEDENVGYKAREYWITHQMPDFVRNWEEVAQERKKLVTTKGFDDLLKIDPHFSILKDASLEQFLDLHYDERKGLIADAKAALLASNKMQLDLYSHAKSRLSMAVSSGFLASGKVGTWLHRIFKSNADPKKIEEFVHGSRKNSLNDLMISWYKVKDRFDKAKSKFKGSNEQTMPRGLYPLSNSQFLAMHYDQRLQYVEELESRMTEAPDVSKEPSIFLEIRHAMDTKDWAQAAVLIASAKKQDMTPEQKARLGSMDQYVRKFNTKESSELTTVMDAKKRIDTIVQQLGKTHSEVQPMVLRLLKGPNANRSIHQFRWITYNHHWCRTHGPPYLDDDIARNGASDDNKELTKHRAEQGEDVGRNDVIDRETADSHYFRKKEYSTHKATYQHTNVASAGVCNAQAEWLEREQDPKTLYWTTYIANSDGDPKSALWHNELFYNLTELRSLTSVLKNHGFMYNGADRPLISRN
jgi:superoxide dismutase